MSKLIAAAVLALLWTAVAAAGQATLGPAIHLNEPGALEALQHSNPTHYEKVRKIADAAGVDSVVSLDFHIRVVNKTLWFRCSGTNPPHHG